MEETLSDLETYGYIFLFFYSIGGGLVGIISAGVLSAFGKMDLILSILIASAGNICGSGFLVYLGRNQKQDFQKYLSKHRRKVALVHLWIKRFGILLIFTNKYIYGFKTILPLVVGVSQYPLKKFFVWNVFASVLWGILSGLVGFLASNLVMRLFEEWKDYSYVLPLVFVALLAVIWAVLRFKEKRTLKHIPFPKKINPI